jgi:hypothetical protein
MPVMVVVGGVVGEAVGIGVKVVGEVRVGSK